MRITRKELRKLIMEQDKVMIVSDELKQDIQSTDKEVEEKLKAANPDASDEEIDAAKKQVMTESFVITKKQLRALIESVLNESIDEAHKAALKKFGLSDDHPIGKLKNNIVVLHQEVKSTVDNASQFAKYAAEDLDLKAQFFRAKKFMYPDPNEPKHIYFKIEKK